MQTNIRTIIVFDFFQHKQLKLCIFIYKKALYNPIHLFIEFMQQKYVLTINNHAVIGHPYIPICKFQIIKTSSTTNKQKSQQSAYINPPVYDPKLIPNQKQKPKLINQNSSYLKQFPIKFQLLEFQENQFFELNLIELTKNGRQKNIGYSKVTLNKKVLNAVTKHKIIKTKIEASQENNNNLKDNRNKGQIQRYGTKQSTSEYLANNGVISTIQISISQSPNKYNPKKRATKRNEQQRNKKKKQLGHTDSSSQQSHLSQQQSQNPSQSKRQYYNEDFQMQSSQQKYNKQEQTNIRNIFAVQNLSSKYKNQHSIYKNKQASPLENNSTKIKQYYNLKPNQQQYKTQQQNKSSLSQYGLDNKDQQSRISLLSESFTKRKQFGSIVKQKFDNRRGENELIYGVNSNNRSQWNYSPDQSIWKQIQHLANQNSLNSSAHPSARKKNKHRRLKFYNIIDQNSRTRTINIDKNHTPSSINYSRNTTNQQPKGIITHNYNTANKSSPTNHPQSYTTIPHTTSHNRISSQVNYYKSVKNNNHDIKNNQIIEQVSEELKNSYRYEFQEQQDNDVGKGKLDSNKLQLQRNRNNSKLKAEEQHKLQKYSFVQYFITFKQTDKNGCNRLNNIHLVYEAAQMQIKPRSITFLTYQLFQKIVRVNCREYYNQQLSSKVQASNEKKHPKKDIQNNQNKYVISSSNGKFKKTKTIYEFNNILLSLPKYCSVLRVEIILEKDQIVYGGKLQNKCGNNIISILRTKNKQQIHQIHLILNIQQISSIKTQPKQDKSSPKKIPKNLMAQGLDQKTLPSQQNQQSISPKLVKKLSSSSTNKKNYKILKTLNSISRYKNSLLKVINSIQQQQLMELQKSRINQLQLQRQEHKKKLQEKQRKIQKNIQTNNELLYLLKRVIKKSKNKQTSKEKSYQGQEGYQIKKHKSKDKIFHVKRKREGFIEDGITPQKQYQSEKESQEFSLSKLKKRKKYKQKIKEESHQLKSYLKSNQVIQQISRQLPKIILQRSNINLINQNFITSKYRHNLSHHHQIQNLSHLPKKLPRTNLSPNNNTIDTHFNKDKIRQQFIKKLVGNKFSRFQQKYNRHRMHTYTGSNMNTGQLSHHNLKKSKINVDEQLEQGKINEEGQNKKKQRNKKKMLTLPNQQLSQSNNKKLRKYINFTPISTKNINYNINKKSQQLKLPRQSSCLRNHNHSTHIHDCINPKFRQSIQRQKHFIIMIEKLQFIKLSSSSLNKQENQFNKSPKYTKGSKSKSKQKVENNDSQNQRFKMPLPIIKNIQKFDLDEGLQIFLKIYVQRKKKKQQLITPSILLKQGQSSQNNLIDQHNKNMKHQNDKSPKTKPKSSFYSCQWNLKQKNFLLQGVKNQDYIVIQAYGDLSKIDHHQFLGKCILGANQIFYLQKAKKITGYMINKKSIFSHITMIFNIVKG